MIMSKAGSFFLVCVLALTAATSMARVVSEVVDDQLVVKYIAANGDLYRVETTTQTSDTTFETVITDGNGKLLGKVQRTVINVMQNGDGTTTYLCRSILNDAHGNYVRTNYTIIIKDHEGKLAQLTDLEGLRDSSDLGIRTLTDDRDFTPLTVGGDLNDNS